MKIFTSKTQQLGQKGENQAASYLKKAGYSIVERNIGNTFGEIDIVAKKAEIYYFFEVKAGRQDVGINPAENLTKTKLQKLFVSVQYYCLIHKILEYRVQGMIILFSPKGDCTVEIMELF